MNKRKPPRKRHSTPRWVKPRMLNEAKRVCASTKKPINQTKAKLVQRTGEVVPVDYVIPPLVTRDDKTRALWTRDFPVLDVLAIPDKTFYRWRNLTFILEGSPLCN